MQKSDYPYKYYFLAMCSILIKKKKIHFCCQSIHFTWNASFCHCIVKNKGHSSSLPFIWEYTMQSLYTTCTCTWPTVNESRWLYKTV